MAQQGGLALPDDPWYIPVRDPREARWGAMPRMIHKRVWVSRVGTEQRERRMVMIDPAALPNEGWAYLHLRDFPETEAPQIGRVELYRMLRPRPVQVAPDGAMGFPGLITARVFEDTTTDPDPDRRQADVVVKKMFRYCVEHRRAIMRDGMGHMIGTRALGEDPWGEVEILRVCQTDLWGGGVAGAVQMYDFMCDATDPYAHEIVRPYFRPIGQPGGIQCFYCVQEYLAGGDLFNAVVDREIHIDDAVIVSWVRQACRDFCSEHFSRLDTPLFTAMAWIFIPAYCFACP